MKRVFLFWTLPAVLLWLWILPHLVSWVNPVSLYFTVERVFVFDAASGEMPRVAVDRTIHRRFDGRWQVSLWRASGSGFELFCTRDMPRPDAVIDEADARYDPNPTLPSEVLYRRGGYWRSYRPDALIPDDADLNWWLEVPPNETCPNLRDGAYMIESWWAILGPGGSVLRLTIQSNVFTIGTPPQVRDGG